jgi:hypothetical protein
MIKLQWKLLQKMGLCQKGGSKEGMGIKREGRKSRGAAEERWGVGEERERHLQKKRVCETGQSENKKYTVAYK